MPLGTKYHRAPAPLLRQSGSSRPHISPFRFHTFSTPPLGRTKFDHGCRRPSGFCQAHGMYRCHGQHLRARPTRGRTRLRLGGARMHRLPASLLRSWDPYTNAWRAVLGSSLRVVEAARMPVVRMDSCAAAAGTAARARADICQ